MSEAGYVLALDLGSSSFKAAVFDSELNRLCDRSEPIVYSLRDSIFAELSPDWVWATVLRVVQRVCDGAGVAPRRLGRLAVTSQAQTFALLGEDGEPLTPFISWMDARADEQADLLRAKLGDSFHTHSSLRPGRELMIAKVLWLKGHHPQVFSRARSVAPLSSWLICRLAGLDVLDTNLASMTGLYTLSARAWWPRALELCGVGEDQLPILVETGVALAAQEPNPELGFADDLSIVCAGNDQSSGAFAVGCKNNSVLVTLGTALSAYRTAGERPGPYNVDGCWGPYPGGEYYELAVRSQGCAALDRAQASLHPGGNLETLFRAAQAAREDRDPRSPGDDAAFFHPDRFERGLTWDGNLDTTRRSLAVLEGIGFSVRQMLADDLQIFPGLASVVAIGGGSRSDLWLQILADILNLPVHRAHADSLLGAAMMATDLHAPRGDCESKTFAPESTHVTSYENLFERWRQT